MAQTKEIVNTIYHSAVTTILAVGFAMAGKKLIKFDVGDPARPDLTEVLKLTTVITLSTFTKDWLVNSKIIPADIVNKTS
jgi:energy-converting hydrogenase Eha subunit G